VTGIKDLLPSENQLFVYPNPANNAVFLKLGKPVSESVRVTFYNALGAVIKSAEIPGTAEQTEISTTMLPDGIYVIRVLSGTKVLGIHKLNISH
jgi:hypothetical protein